MNIFALDTSLYRLLGGRLVGRDIPILTTAGRKSGRRRSTLLFHVRDGSDYVIVASNGGESTVANASAILPGADRFATLPDSSVDLSFLLPSVGVIDLEGVPFLGDGTDTIVERLQGIDPFNICPAPPCSDTIDIELVALSLMSVSPVDLFSGVAARRRIRRNTRKT